MVGNRHEFQRSFRRHRHQQHHHRQHNVEGEQNIQQRRRQRQNTIARIHRITSGTPRLPPRSSARNDLVVFAIQFKHLFGNGNMSVQGRARLCTPSRQCFHLQDVGQNVGDGPVQKHPLKLKRNLLVHLGWCSKPSAPVAGTRPLPPDSQRRPPGEYRGRFHRCLLPPQTARRRATSHTATPRS